MSSANSADPDQTPHDVASDQGLHSLLTGYPNKNRTKAKNRPDTSKMANRFLQHITAEKSTNIQWVKCRPLFGRAAPTRDANRKSQKVRRCLLLYNEGVWGGGGVKHLKLVVERQKRKT